MKKWIEAIIVALFAVFGGPIAINLYYKNNSGCITMWNAADILSYYGAIIASAGAAIGVYVSILQAHKQYRDDKRRDVLPYFSINVLNRQPINPVDFEKVAKPSDTGEPAIYQEMPFNQNFFIFEDKEIRRTTKLTAEEDEIRKTGFSSKHGECGDNYSQKKYIPMEMTNVGKGCAINTIISIESTARNLKDESLPISLLMGEKSYIGLVFVACGDISGSYDITVQYSDIYGNCYIHHKSMVIVGKNISIDYSTTHVLIKEAEKLCRHSHGLARTK